MEKYVIVWGYGVSLQDEINRLSKIGYVVNGWSSCMTASGYPEIQVIMEVQKNG